MERSGYWRDWPSAFRSSPCSGSTLPTRNRARSGLLTPWAGRSPSYAEAPKQVWVGPGKEPPERPAGAGASDSPLVHVKDLQVHSLISHGAVRTVDGVSFDIKPGEVLGLAGQSGSGKCTIVQALFRILSSPAVIVNGSVPVQGKDVLAMTDVQMQVLHSPELSMVFQRAMNALNPVMTVSDHIVPALLAPTSFGVGRHQGGIAASTRHFGALVPPLPKDVNPSNVCERST